MKLLIFSTCLIMAAFLLHWVLWRIRVPRNPLIALLTIFFGVLSVALIVNCVAGARWDCFPHGLWENLHVVIFHTALSLAYMINYSGLEEDSPSFTMVKFVDIAGEGGRRREEFSRIITNERSIQSRLQALVSGGLIVKEGGKWCLTARGRFWNRLFLSWMWLLNIRAGG